MKLGAHTSGGKCKNMDRHVSLHSGKQKNYVDRQRKKPFVTNILTDQKRIYSMLCVLLFILLVAPFALMVEDETEDIDVFLKISLITFLGMLISRFCLQILAELESKRNIPPRGPPHPVYSFGRLTPASANADTFDQRRMSSDSMAAPDTSSCASIAASIAGVFQPLLSQSHILANRFGKTLSVQTPPKQSIQRYLAQKSAPRRVCAAVPGHISSPQNSPCESEVRNNREHKNVRK